MLENGGDMVRIDGSLGEGGGQILRSSLTLSALTGKPLEIHNIRANRPKPGLAPQHVKAVEAAAAVCGAKVEGAQFGSQTLTFEPGEIRAGDYTFDIGTAGSTSLVLQTVFLPLSFAESPSTVSIEGGTHVPWSPSFHFLEKQYLPWMRRIGFDLDLKMERAGFYPRGGGLVQADIRPATHLSPISATERGRLQRIRGISGVANLPFSIGERQRARALKHLAGFGVPVEIETVEVPALSPGTFLFLAAEFEGSCCCASSLGARGKPAEKVADEAAGELAALIRSDGAIDKYLCDQLLLPLALIDGVSDLRTAEVTRHLLTNADIVRKFLPAEITIEGELGEAGTLRVVGSR